MDGAFKSFSGVRASFLPPSPSETIINRDMRGGNNDIKGSHQIDCYILIFQPYTISINEQLNNPQALMLSLRVFYSNHLLSLAEYYFYISDHASIPGTDNRIQVI